MDDNCSEVLQKKRRLEKEILGESDDDKEYVSDFLFRLPATPSEIAQIADKARSNIESIHKAISEGGYDAYIKLRSSSYEDKCNPDSHETIDSVEDTTDALEEESIVKGDPRWYQTAMFELAKSRNTIVTLETGKGKTLIALLLIRHLSHTFQEGKRTLFLVPSVALATQHATTIRANLPYTVATASYNSARKPGAKEAMATANILVATHGAMLDLFMHYGDLFQMHTINLLIVDECHYARGDHGYVQIMKNFYYPLDAHARPRVLGLTASPLMSVRHDVSDEKIATELRQLEETLDSTIVCIPQLIEDENKSVEFKKQEAEERIVYYKSASDLPLFPSHVDIGLHPPREKEFNQFIDLYKELGPMVCSIYSNTVARELSRNKSDGETVEQYQSAINHLTHISAYCEDISRKCSNGGKSEKVALLEQLLEDMIEYKKSKNCTGVVFVEKRITAVALSDYFRTRLKRLTLGNWLRVENTEHCRRPKTPFSHSTLHVPRVAPDGYLDIHSVNIKDMNMTEIEDVSIYSTLQEFIPKGLTMRNLIDTELVGQEERSDFEAVDAGNRSIRCDLAVRKCTQLFRYVDRTNKETDLTNDDDWLHKNISMEKVLDGLKTDRTNLLFATSVVEEGVDISSCSFVVAFDNIKSTKAYVQMKGRARQQHAKFFVFQDTSPILTNQYIDLKAAQVTCTRVKQFIESRPQYFIPLTEKKLKIQPYKHETYDLELSAVEQGEYRTNFALVNLKSARNLLNRYVLSIPDRDTFPYHTQGSLRHVPHFENNRLILPAHLPISVRCVEIPDKYKNCRRKEKEGILSLIACVRLHQLYLLNDRLLPLKKKDMQKKLLGVVLSSITLPPPSKPTSTLNSVFIYELEQNGMIFDKNRRVLGCEGISLCFITLSPLPEVCLTNNMSFVHQQFGEINVHVRKLRKTTFDKIEWDLCNKFQTALFNARWRKESSSTFYAHDSETCKNKVLPSSAIGCLNNEREIDWNTMITIINEFQRSKEERIDAVRKHSGTNDFKKPRIWVPTYDTCASYISYGPSGLQCTAPFPEMTASVRTYADYFKEIKKCPIDKTSYLFSVQHQWYLPSKIRREIHKTVHQSRFKDIEMTHTFQDNHRSLCDGLTTTLLPLDLCMEAPIADAGLFFLCTFLPQILYSIERIAVDHFDEILEALTTKSCDWERSYDRLEWLGDAVLKLIHTDSLLYSYDLCKWVSCLREGDLSLLRSSLGSNKRLCSICESIGFDKYILFRPLDRCQWSPTGTKLYAIQNDGTHIMSETNQSQPGTKTCADVIESVIGLIYVRFGFRAAYDVASELGMTLTKEINYGSAISECKRKPELEDAASSFLGGFRFKQPSLIEEALTHPSCVYEQVPCYQLLEWVGDAVLCLFARNWIFHKFPNMRVSELATMESSIVCNETLAYICATNKLQVYMNHMDTSLPKKFTDFEHSLGLQGRGLWATDPPKALSDIVEALIGAVYVDAGNTECHRALDHILKPVLDCLLQIVSNGNITDKKTVNRMIGHPKQYIVENLGDMLRVTTWREDKCALREPKIRCPIWKDGFWGTSSYDGSNYIALVEIFGIELFGVEEKSARVALNRTCALVVEIFENNPDLGLKLQDIMVRIRNGALERSDTRAL